MFEQKFARRHADARAAFEASSTALAQLLIMAAPGPEGEEDGFSSLSGDQLHHLLTFLPAKELAAFACTSRAHNAAAQDDRLWTALLHHDWRMQAEHSTARETFAEQQLEFGEERVLYTRLRACVEALRSFAAVHLPEASPSLLPGAAKEEVDALWRSSTFTARPFPAALRILWRLVRGGVGADAQFGTGILGGLQVYNHVSSSYFVTQAESFALSAMVGQRADLLPVAASRPLTRLLLLHVHTGELFMYPRGRRAGLERASPEGAADGLALWLEAYVRKLQTGQFTVSPLSMEDVFSDMPSPPRSVSLFPTATPPTPATAPAAAVRLTGAPFSAGSRLQQSLAARLETPPPEIPLFASATTRGVVIQASACLVPEMSDGQRDSYAYRIHMRLQSAEEQMASRAGGGGGVVASVQLRSRHWVVHDGEQEHVVVGEGVIGYTPTLVAGGAPFFYQSQTHVVRGSGWMRGEITFAVLEGEGAGGSFRALCPQFAFRRPEDGILF